MNFEKTSNDLHDLQENYRLVVSKLKEKECTISKLLKSGKSIDDMLQRLYAVFVQLTKLYALFCLWTENALIDRAKEMCTDLQNASDDINFLSSKLGMITLLFIFHQYVLCSWYVALLKENMLHGTWKWVWAYPHHALIVLEIGYIF